jgi:hypothetical protein
MTTTGATRERPAPNMASAICAWSGCLFIALFAVGVFALAHFIPPLDPNLSANEVAEIYHGNSYSIRIGLVVCMLGTVCMLSYGAALSGQIRRIVGIPSALVHLQIASYSASVLIIIIPLLCWSTAAFRQGQRDPALIQLLNDMGWLCFVGGVGPYIAWAMSAGVAILSDRAATPVFPRWSGYLSIFVAIAQIPGGFVALFVSGPLAWNGIFAWWIPLTTFFTWTAAMIFVTVKATSQEVVDAHVLSRA